MAFHLYNRGAERKGRLSKFARHGGNVAAARTFANFMERGNLLMPIVLIILLAILIGTVGFWDGLGAILGAVALLVLFWILVVATVLIAAIWLIRKAT